MAKQRGTSTGGGRTKNARQRLINQRIRALHGGITGPVGRDPFSPDPNSTRKNFPTSDFFPPVENDRAGSARLRKEAGPKKQKKLRARITAKELRKGLPPIQNAPAPPGIMAPGTGIAAGGRGGGRIRGGGGQIPSVDTSLNVDDKGILKRAHNAARIEYNPQIEAVRNLIQSTKSSTQRDITDVQGAYGAVQNQIQSEIPQIGQNFDTQQSKIQQAYDALSQGINQTYDATAARNQAEFERLGIQAALPQTQQGMTSDRDFLSQIAKLQGQGVQDVLETEQQGAQNLARNTGYRVGLEGANRASDLQSALADKILELRTQKGSLRANKARTVRELQDQYRSEAQAQAERDRAFGLDVAQFQEGVRESNRDFRYGREQDRANLALGAAKLQAEQAQQSAQDFKDLDPQERAAAKADQLVPGSGDRMFAYLQNLINSDKNIRRGFYIRTDNSGRQQRVPITPQQFGHLARKHAKITGLPAGSVQKIAEAYWNEQ